MRDAAAAIERSARDVGKAMAIAMVLEICGHKDARNKRHLVVEPRLAHTTAGQPACTASRAGADPAQLALKLRADSVLAEFGAEIMAHGAVAAHSRVY